MKSVSRILTAVRSRLTVVPTGRSILFPSIPIRRCVDCNGPSKRDPQGSNPGIRSTSRRRYPILRPACFCLFAAAMIATLFPPDTTIAQIKNWNSGNGSWGTANLWTPNGVPGNANSVWLGNLPGVQDFTVFLNQDATIAQLNIINGMALQNEGHLIVVNGNTSISGEGSRLNINNAAFGSDFVTDNLSIGDGSRMLMEDSGVIVQDQLSIAAGGELRRLYPSTGIMEFSANNGTTLLNDGEIGGGPGSMLFLQQQDGLYDLDGNTGNGHIFVSGTSDASMTFGGPGLTDTFSGDITLGAHATLVMNIFGGWTADANSNITVFSAGIDSDTRLTGNPVQLAGTIIVSGSEADFHVQADATLASTADVTIDNESRMEFVPFWSADVNGGTYTIEQFGELTFAGETEIGGGEFNTFSDSPADGDVQFNGDTVWNGIVTINGIARQNGNAVVAAPTVIHAQRMDMDGVLNPTWDVNSSLAVNTISIGSSAGDTFGGTFDIGNGALAHLTVNLDAPLGFWTMAGEMHVSNNLPFQSTKVGGSRMRMTGDLSVNGANVRFLADTDFRDGSNTTFETVASSLVMRGTTTVQSAALFMGEGTFINGSDGHLLLEDGASLNELDLLNQALLEIGNPTGIADVASFESTANANWQVEIGGHVAGDEHDVLLVGNGNAILDGRLSVKLIDAGNGLFVPEVGDEFTILSTVDSVVGEFDNAPISIADGTGYQWEVLYNSNDVTLRLASTIADLILGDVNGDGTVDLLDVSPFVNAVTNGTYIIQADMNCDGAVDLLDVNLFVELLTG